MKRDYTLRHPGPELMDRDDIPEADLSQNYRELHIINRYLGGYRITLKGMSQLVNGSESLSVLDAGSGGGDTLKAIASWAEKKGITLNLTGVDISPAAINYAKENCRSFPQIKFVQDDIFHHLSSGNKYDIIVNSLLMHHFTDAQITRLLLMMKDHALKGFVINDLQRDEVAYNSIKWLTKIFSKSYLVKNDAPLSVLRGFLLEDWWHLLSKAYISTAVITNEWAFRYLIVYRILDIHDIPVF